MIDRDDWRLPERTARLDTIHKGLTKVMREIGASNLHIRTDPLAEPTPRASVYFELGGQAFRVEADGHGRDASNLRAVEQYLTHSWNAAKEGVGGFEQTFMGLPAPGSHDEAAQGIFARMLGGFQATPDEILETVPMLPDPSDPYHVLGLSSGVSLEGVRTRFRVLARTMHPDAGGSEEEFKRIQAAFSAIKEMADTSC